MAEPAQQSRASTSPAVLELATWIVVYLALRALLVLLLGDVFFYGEELAKAAAGRTLGAGTGLAWHELPYVTYEGGGFLFSHLDRAAFALFGPSLLALKLVPLFWGALVVAASWWLASELFDRSTARWFMALFVFAPASFQKSSLLSLGIHYEALVFVAVAFALAARIAFGGDDRLRTWLALGACIGFGAWFSYSTLSASAYGLGAIVVMRPRAFRRGSVVLTTGALVGALPLAWMLATAGGEVLRVHGDGLLSEAGVRGASGVVASHLQAIYGGRAPLEFAAMLAMPVIVITGLVQVLRTRASQRAERWGGRERTRRERFVAGYLLLFVAVYLFSGFAEPSLEHGFHLKRASQIWYVASLVCAATLARWRASDRPAPRSVAAALASVLLASGAFDVVAIARAGGSPSLARAWHTLTSTKGYAWTSYVRSLEPRIEGDAQGKLRVLARLPEPDRGWIFAAISDQVWLTSRPELDEVLRDCKSAGGDDWPAFLRGLGTWWRRISGPDIRARTQLAQEQGPAVAPLLIEATGRDAVGPRVTEETLRAEIARGRDRDLPAAFFVGVGSRIPECLGELPSSCPVARSARPWLLHRELAEAFLEKQDPRIRSALREGCDRAYAERELR